jgi:hypothetical protein
LGFINEYEERSESLDIKYLRLAAGYTLYDHKLEEEMREE